MKTRFRFFTLGLVVWTASLGLLHSQTDSLPIFDLAALTVSAEQNVLPIGAPVARLAPLQIQRYDQVSLLAGFNSIPGARFEQRSPGSYRISIRGSSLRAPFGVRNVKIYWNGLPLTEPGGDTFLNFIDPANMESLTVFKGPAGSLYGSGVGGAVLLNSVAPTTPDNETALQVQAGSFGSARVALSYRRTQSPRKQQHFRLAHQRTDGYRDHSQFRRTVAEFGLFRNNGSGKGYSFHALATDLFYEIPGGLNPTQYEENPRQARPGSADSRASIQYRNLLVGARFYGPVVPEKLRHETSVYASGNVFNHPFNIDHKRENNFGIGTRSVVSHERYVNGLGDLRVDAGLEIQLANKAARNYRPNAGTPGELNFIDDINTWQGLLFTQANLALNEHWEVTAGLSFQKLQLDVDRTFNVNGPRENSSSDFSWVLAPRLSIARRWRDDQVRYSAFISYGLGYSPPTLSEFRTNEGSLNTDLQPERGGSYEFGFRRRSPTGFNLDLNVYAQRLSQSITTFQDSSGVQLFQNAGGSNQFGVEATVFRELLPLRRYANSRFNSLLFQLSYAYQSGQYRNYVEDGADFSGNDLPGLTPHSFDGQLTLTTKWGYYARLGVYSNSETPLDDKNEVFSDRFALLRLRIGRQFQLGGYEVDAYLGGNNLLNQRHSFGYDLNPRFGDRYFQPAATANFYLGARIAFLPSGQ